MILSSYALQVLPVGWLGVALILLACVLFVADFKVLGHGLPTLGGIAVLVLGILILLGPSTSSYLLASLVALVAVAIFVGILFVGLSEAHADKGSPVSTGIERMIGEVGVVRKPVGSSFPGWVFVHGERWQAIAAVAPEDAHKQDREQVIGAGRRVQVASVRDGKVAVLPFEPAAFVRELT